MPPRRPRGNEVEKRVEKLKSLIGNITTNTQAITSSHWLDRIRLDGESQMNDQAWMLHCPRNDPDFDRIWDTISFYRIIGEVPAFVIPAEWKPDNLEFDELCLLGERWVYLAAEGELGSLEDTPEGRLVTEKGGSLAERLKAYLEAHQRRVGFEKWDIVHIHSAKYRVIEVYDAFFKRTGRPYFKSEGPTGAQIRRNMSSIIPTELPYQDILDEAALLKERLGGLRTSEEIAKAAEYSDPVVNGDRGELQKEAFDHYVLRSFDPRRVFAEIEIHRLVGQSSAYFGPANHFNVPAIQELAKVVRDWVALEARGLLITLVEKGYNNASIPARLKEYMEAYKAHKEIARRGWIPEDLKGLRFSILTDPMGVLEASSAPKASVKRPRDSSTAAETESAKRPKESATEALALSRPAANTRGAPVLPQRATVLPERPQPAADHEFSSRIPARSSIPALPQFPSQRSQQAANYESPYPAQAAGSVSDSNQPAATSSSRPDIPRTQAIYLKKIEDIVEQFYACKEGTLAKQKAYSIVAKAAGRAEPLIEEHRNELSRVTTEINQTSGSPNFNGERFTLLLAKAAQEGGKIKELTDLVANKKGAKEELDAAEDKLRGWKAKMEALDLLIDDSKPSSG